MSGILHPCSYPGCPALLPRGQSRCEKHRHQDRGRQQAEARRLTAAQRGYGRKWQKARAEYLALHPWCVECKRQEKLVQATDLDHIIPHQGDEKLMWDRSNWQPLCAAHHSAKTAVQDGRWAMNPNAIPDIQPSRIPVTVVCGPPGSGKTRYVQEHAGPRDLAIDLDAIRAELSGMGWYRSPDEWIGPALARRNQMLAALANDRVHERVWLIVSAPRASDRREWRQKLGDVQVIVMAVEPHVCIDRIRQDTRRRGRETEFEAAVHRWWERYVTDPADEVLRG